MQMQIPPEAAIHPRSWTLAWERVVSKIVDRILQRMDNWMDGWHGWMEYCASPLWIPTTTMTTIQEMTAKTTQRREDNKETARRQQGDSNR